MARLEFCLPAADLPRLLGRPEFGRRSGRSVATELVWYDTADGMLAAAGLSLCQANARWRLERSSPRPGASWPLGTPAPLVAEAADPAALGPLPEPLMPMAGFRGERRVIRLNAEQPATLCVLTGTTRGVAQERPACRLVVDGAAPLLAGLTMEWAGTLPIAPPRCSLAAEALALARGTAPPLHGGGGADVPIGMNVADAFAFVVGHLADVILNLVSDAAAGLSPTPVHDMRVAVRRLRSALSVFARAAGPALSDMKPPLSALARTLGQARDWDVFLADTGHDVAAAFPEDGRIEALLSDATRQRNAAYAALQQEFGSPAFRQLTIGLVHLAALRQWEADADEERLARLHGDAGEFAAGSLTRQHRRLVAAGPEIGELPMEELHVLRKQGKKLRYTIEFFINSHNQRRARRYLRRLSQVQEALGHLNDGAAASTLMQPLAGAPARQFAIGAVLGFTAGRNAQSRTAVVRSWSKFHAAKPFWL